MHEPSPYIQLFDWNRNLVSITDQLVAEAKKSTCTRSKCAAIILYTGNQNVVDFIGHGIIAQGHNSQPASQCNTCFKDNLPANFKSDKTCCVHAEQRAIMKAVRSYSMSFLQNCDLFFLRLDENDKPSPAGQPYCTICSKMALDVGIKYFWLMHTEGWTRYETNYYNELSFKYNGKV